MTLFAPYALQKAIYDTLTNDSGLMAVINGVFDHVPPSTDYPYITLGDSQAQDFSTATSTAYQHTLTLHIYSRARGRKEVLDIMQKLHALLHDANPAATDHAVVNLRYANSDVRVQKDGLTTAGEMTFRAVTELTV